MRWYKGLVVEKDSSDVLDWKFDFAGLTNASAAEIAAALDEGFVLTDWLQAGETIATRTVTVDAGLTKDSDSITDTNTSVTVWLSGGTVGTVYEVACKIVTNTPRTLEKSVFFKVV